MEVTMGIDIDEIIEGVCDSTEFDRVVDDKLDDKLADMVDPGRLDDIDNRLDDLDRHLVEVIDEALANAGVNRSVEDAVLDQRVAVLEATVARQTEALDAAVKLIRALSGDPVTAHIRQENTASGQRRPRRATRRP